MSGIVTPENRDYWNEKLTGVRRELERLGARREELQEIAHSGLGVYEDAKAMAKALKHYADLLARAEEDFVQKRNAVLALVKRTDLPGRRP